MEIAQSDRLSRESLGEKAADLLRRKILSGDLLPDTRLVEDELAVQMGTSRGPLRYAFSLLAREGLVSVSPGKGTYVTGLSPESIQQLYDVRAVLEAHSVELATQHIDEQGARELQLLTDRMEKAVQEGRVSDFAQLVMELHRTIWQLSGNPHLIRVLEYLSTPCFALLALNVERLVSNRPDMVRDHREMVASMIAGDETAAAEHLRRSLRDGMKGAVSIARAQLAAAPGSL